MTERALQRTMNDVITANLKRRIQAPTNIDAYEEMVLKPRIFTPPPVSIARREVSDIIGEWRLTVKMNARHTGRKVNPNVPLPPLE